MPSQYGPVSVNVNTGALEYASGSVDSTSITDGSIVNADINASAAIAASKLTGVVTQALADAKGDTIVATAADTFARLAVGTDGQSPVADSAAAAGVRWATKAAAARRTAGNLTVNSTSVTDLTAAMDLTLVARAGDLIMVGVNGMWGNEAVWGYLDVATIVSAAAVNYASSGTGTQAGDGLPGWIGETGEYDSIGGVSFLTVAAGDLSSGSVTLRLRTKTSAASNKTLNASSGTPLTFSAVNLGA